MNPALHEGASLPFPTGGRTENGQALEGLNRGRCCRHGSHRRAAAPSDVRSRCIPPAAKLLLYGVDYDGFSSACVGEAWRCRPLDGTVGIVLSGGGARGAYEFGALEVLAPVLNEPARIIVGTSAGGLGAAYLAADAQDGLEAAARFGGQAWLAVEIGDVIGPLCSPRELARVLLYRARAAGHRCAGPTEPAGHQPAAGHHRGPDRLQAAWPAMSRMARWTRSPSSRPPTQRREAWYSTTGASHRPAMTSAASTTSRPGSRSSMFRPPARSSRYSRPYACKSAGMAMVGCGSTRR